MTDFADMTDAMVRRFREGFGRAVENGIPEPTAMTLATVDEQGRPAARTVLLKDMDRSGFVFYTNLGSRKGRHLEAHADVSLVFWWRENAEQVMVDGMAEPVTAREADAYFASRPRGSQIGAWASQQSRPLESRFALEKAVAKFTARYAAGAVPRPEYWLGYRLKPLEIEFWHDRPFRLHERIVFRRTTPDEPWSKTRLYP